MKNACYAKPEIKQQAPPQNIHDRLRRVKDQTFAHSELGEGERLKNKKAVERHKASSDVLEGNQTFTVNLRGGCHSTNYMKMLSPPCRILLTNP